MSYKLSRKLFSALSLAVILAMVIAPIGLADNTVADGDGVIPVGDNDRALGDVCLGSPQTFSVQVAIKRTGSGTNVFKDGSSVTVSVHSASSGLSGSMASPSTITLPSNWGSLDNNVMSSAVSSSVTFTPAVLGTFSGSVTYRGSGVNSSNATINRDDTMNVTANVISCAPTDTTPPVLSLPADITAEATGSSGAVATYTASANDAVDGPVAISCSPASGSPFALGTTTVSCSASDAAGNTANGSFSVSVVDTTAPVLSLPASITAEATGPTGAAVSFTATASDLVDGSVAVSCSPASGSTFAMGATTVNCSATDAHSNTGSSSFDVTVQDTTAPALTLPDDITAEATGPSGAAVTFSASALDIVYGSVPVICSSASGSTFALGITTVNCSAADEAGNEASGSFDVTIQDTTPPELTLPADITAEATGASGAVVTFSAIASDLVDGSVAVTCSPTSDSTFALGSTEVNCSATDAHENTGSGSFNISVVDTTPPVITLNGIVNGGSYTLGGVPAASCTALDLVSGSVACSVAISGGTPSGIGLFNFTASAVDGAGNQASVSGTYTVNYGICVLYDQTKTHKAGSTVPLKLQLCDANGVNFSASSIVVTATGRSKIDNNASGATEDSGNANPDSNFRYDPTLGGTGGYIYNLSTKGFTTGTWKVTFTVNGTSYVFPNFVQFDIK